ncbi:MAG: redoxin domain-containing protein [Pyrinomonadaceae bacterium]|nr:redoxin domain-containing protein [Phycisphaerales bacterium]
MSTTPPVTLRPHLTPITVGEVAPNFTLKDQLRADWNLADAVKKGDVVLCFFPLAFTSVCSTEMKCVNDEMGKWEAKGATVVGISCDSFAALKAWADQMGLKQTLLADMHREVCKAYGLYWPDLNCSSRGTIVIGQDASGTGKVLWVQAREPGKAMTFEEVLAHVG